MSEETCEVFRLKRMACRMAFHGPDAVHLENRINEGREYGALRQHEQGAEYQHHDEDRQKPEFLTDPQEHPEFAQKREHIIRPQN